MEDRILLKSNGTFNDIKKALEYIVYNKDIEAREIFLTNCKSIIISLVNELLESVKRYPTPISYNKNVFEIDRLLFLAKSLYGDELLPIFQKNINLQDDEINYSSSYERYNENVSRNIFYDRDLINNLKAYNKELSLDKKYKGINKNTLEQAYSIFFSLTDILDIDSYNDRKQEFIKKNNIDYNTFIDYILLYGYRYLNLASIQMKKRVSDTLNLMYNTYNDELALENVIKKIIESYDINVLKELIYTHHISPYIVKKIIQSNNSYNRKYGKDIDSIINKVNKVIELLHAEKKFIHYSITLQKLINCNDKKVLEDIVKNNMRDLNKTNINLFVKNYKTNLNSLEKERLTEELLKKIKDIKEKVKADKDMNNTLKKEQDLKDFIESFDITPFFSDDIKTVDEYCNAFNISKNSFYTYLSYIETNNKELYLKVKEKIRKERSQRYSVIVNKTNTIADEIINGIKEDNEATRNFEILDYFLKTKLDFKEFMDIYTENNNVDIESLRKLRQFFKKNKLTNKIIPRQELNGTTIFMIGDAPYEVSKEEKEKTINYLNKKTIPLYTKVYKQALKRCVNGTLFEEVKEFKNVKRG